MDPAVRSPAFLITGPESVLVDRATATTVDRLVRLFPDRPVRTVLCGRRTDQGGSPADDIVQSMAPSLFGDTPILVIRDLDQADESAQQAIRRAFAEPERPPIVVTHNGGARGRGVVNAAPKSEVEVVKCVRPQEREVRSLVRDEAAAAGGRLTPAAEQWLVTAIGTGELAVLLSATRQAVLDSADGAVDEEAVQLMFPGQAGVTAFKVVDHLWAGDVAAATRLLRVMEQRERGVGVSVVAALAHGLRMMALVGMRGAQPPADLPVAPWQRDRAREQARRWGATGARVAAVTARLPDLDADMKGGLDGGVALDDEQKMALLEQVVAQLATGVSPTGKRPA